MTNLDKIEFGAKKSDKRYRAFIRRSFSIAELGARKVFPCIAQLWGTRGHQVFQCKFKN